MVYTFRAIYNQVLRYLDEEGATSTSTTRLIVEDAVNQALQQRWAQYPWTFKLWPREETLTTVVGQRYYSLHPQCDRLLWIYNATTKAYVQEYPVQALATDDEQDRAILGGWHQTSGPAQGFITTGVAQVKNQPTSASTISIVSNSTSDTGTAYQVLIKGQVSGEIVSELVTLNGTTPVASTNSFTYVLAITKSQAFNGQMTATSNSGAVTVIALTPNELGRHYRQIMLLETPTTAETLSYQFYRKPLLMVNDYDVVDIPSELSQLIVWDALLSLSTYNSEFGAGHVAIWRDNQDRWERALFSNYGFASTTLGGNTQTVRWIDRG